MWDVKDWEMNGLYLGYRFYLNYVGCKDNFFYLALIRRFRFYLNYVGCKVFYPSFERLIPFRFTLTMWDVKFIMGPITFIMLSTFYLNYVGCKVVSGTGGGGGCVARFTLTMWDVKQFDRYIVSCCLMVLP